MVFSSYEVSVKLGAIVNQNVRHFVCVTIVPFFRNVTKNIPQYDFFLKNDVLLEQRGRGAGRTLSLGLLYV